MKKDDFIEGRESLEDRLIDFAGPFGRRCLAKDRVEPEIPSFQIEAGSAEYLRVWIGPRVLGDEQMMVTIRSDYESHWTESVQLGLVGRVQRDWRVNQQTSVLQTENDHSGPDFRAQKAHRMLHHP